MENRLKKWIKAIRACRPEYLAAVVLFLLAVPVGAGALLFAPKQAFSDNENRALEPAPQMTAEAVADGSFMTSFQAFVNDHFPFRRSLVELYSISQFGLGRRDLGGDYTASPPDGGAYVGKDGHLYEVLLPDKLGVFKRNLASLNQFAKETALPFYLMPVPSSAQEQPENLPSRAPSHDQREELRAAQAIEGENVKVIDLFETLKQENGDFYYKTDHHWNTDGAYEGYCALSTALGMVPREKSEFEFRGAAQPFFGTLYSKSLLPWQTSDILYLPYFRGEQNVTQTVGKQERTGEEALFWTEYLSKKDKYSTFLGGNHSVEVLKNSAAPPGTRLLVIKDSYFNSMAPFLITDVAEIHIIDLRYYSQNIYEYIEENGITQIAAVYSIKQLCDVSFGGKLLPRK